MIVNVSAERRDPMWHAIALLAGSLCWCFALASLQASAQGRKVKSLDAGWRFTLGEQIGAEAPSFDDKAWCTLDVPHDWSIEGPVSKTNPVGESGGFFPAGIGWYRKSFVLPAGTAPGELPSSSTV